MLISPPFLPARGANDTDEAWLDLAMAAPASRDATTLAPEGSFPLSHSLAWHNGLHIQAPTGLPARAIADGTVVFVNPPRTKVTEVTDAQNYNPFARAGAPTAAWTDNGCVIVEHTTTIGAAGTAETQVVFYSVYMHLRELGRNVPPGQTTGPFWATGNPIWRKDVVGLPGEIYGATEQIHFEICCNQDQIRNFIGRDHNWVNPEAIPAPTADGRTDSIFGSIYFYLPADTPTVAGNTQPVLHMRGAVAGTTPLGTSRWVKMTYHRGGCQFDSFTTQGVPAGTIGPHVDEEYNLYAEANERHDTLTPAQKTTSSPSGWYELLRFGRNVGNGTTSDLLPATAAHWRQIQGPAGAVWADLNAPGTFKFSDADFLPMLGWNCVFDDSNPNDQRCDSDNLKSVVRDQDPTNANRMQVEQLAAQLGGDAVRKKLRKMICKFPSEWDRGTTAARYGFVQELEAFKEAPEAWPLLKAHLEGISFTGLHAGYLAADWHWHPREFIEVFRKCGWLSLAELASTFPKHLFYTETGNPRTAITTNNAIYTMTRARAQAAVTDYLVPLNRCLRKYIGHDKKRVALFLAQVMLETAQWRNPGGTRRLMHEWGFGAYSAANPATEFYTVFYGRGIMQLTWAGNYRDYGNFRKLADHAGTYVERRTGIARRITATSRHYSANPNDGGTEFLWAPRFDPDLVGEQSHEACDSGGVYWVSKQFSEGININRVVDRIYNESNTGFVNRLVNGGGNGYYERQAYTAFMLRVLTDGTATATQVSLTPPAPKAAVRANMERAV